MQNQWMPKHTATATMEGTRKRGTLCKDREGWGQREFRYNVSTKLAVSGQGLETEEYCNGIHCPQRTLVLEKNASTTTP